MSFGHTITVSHTCSDNNTISIDVDIANFNDVSGITIKISYDNTIINNPTISNQMIGMSGGIELNDPNTPNLITLGWLGKASIFSTSSFEYDFVDGTLYTITFDVVGAIGNISNLNITFEEILTGTTTPTVINNVSTNDGSATISANCTLPVEMISFNVDIEKNNIMLFWLTATELNNSHFEVEKSKDGELWENIGVIEGKGTTNELQNYEFIDTEPFEGLNYYRLKQVDLNDDFEYSDIRSLFFKLDQLSVKISPNPSQNFFQITNLKEGKIFIYNVDGVLISIETILEKQQNIHIKYLEKGIYFLKIFSINNEYISTKTLVKN